MDSRWFEKEVALQNACRVQEALKEYHTLAQATVDLTERAMVILNEVNCLSDLGQATDARARLNDARALLPETSEFRANAEVSEACLDRAEGKFKRALKKLESVLREHANLLQTPNHRFLYEDIQIGRGMLLVELGRSPEARAILEEALTFDLDAEDRGSVLCYLGRCYLDLGELSIARERYEEALKNGGAPTHVETRARYELGRIYYHNEAYARAKEQFELREPTADASYPSKQELWQWLAKTCERLGLKSDAERYANLARTAK